MAVLERGQKLGEENSKWIDSFIREGAHRKTKKIIEKKCS